MTKTKTICACGSGTMYQDCCGRYYIEAIPAPTAEALMRSRYTAFVLGEIDYLVATTFPGVRTANLRSQYQSTCKSVQWIGLEVIRVSQGASPDKTGTVDFKASYIENGNIRVHHECSRFRRSGGRWYYIDGIQHGE